MDKSHSTGPASVLQRRPQGPKTAGLPAPDQHFWQDDGSLLVSPLVTESQDAPLMSDAHAFTSEVLHGLTLFFWASVSCFIAVSTHCDCPDG
jgi:hypothetical protein